MSAWTRAVPLADLPPGTVRSADVDGSEVVVFAGRSGRLGAVARVCPHLDWDLAEGIVAGDELVCTGHGWSFTAEGRALKRTESGREDPKGTIACYAVRVEGGWVEVAPAAGPGA